MARVPHSLDVLRKTEVRLDAKDEKGNAIPKAIFLGNEEAVRIAIEEAEPWRKKDAAALDEIIAVVPSSLLHLVCRCTMARQVWESLRT